jgi:hypothetical protein
MQMKYSLILLVVVVALIIPTIVFADSGAGVSIGLTTTVTGGSSGSGWHDWGSGGSYYTSPSNEPKKPSPYNPPITNSSLPIPPTYPQYGSDDSKDTESDETVAGTATPIESEPYRVGNTMVIILLVAAVGLVVYFVIKMRKKAQIKEGN